MAFYENEQYKQKDDFQEEPKTDVLSQINNEASSQSQGIEVQNISQANTQDQYLKNVKDLQSTLTSSQNNKDQAQVLKEKSGQKTETFRLSDISSSKKNDNNTNLKNNSDTLDRSKQNSDSAGGKDEQTNSGTQNLFSSIKGVFSSKQKKDTSNRNSDQAISQKDNNPPLEIDKQQQNLEKSNAQILGKQSNDNTQNKKLSNQISQLQTEIAKEVSSDFQDKQILTSVIQDQAGALQSTQKGLQSINDMINQIQNQVTEIIPPQNLVLEQIDDLRQKQIDLQQLQQNLGIREARQDDNQDVTQKKNEQSQITQSSIDTIKPALQNISVPKYDIQSDPQVLMQLGNAQDSSAATIPIIQSQYTPSRPQTSPTTVNIVEPLMQRLRPQSPPRIRPTSSYITPKGRYMKGQEVLSSIERLSQRQSSYIKTESINDLQRMLEVLNIKDAKDLGGPKAPLKLTREELESTILRLYSTNKEKYQVPPRIRSARLIFVKDTNGFKESYKDIPLKKNEDRTQMLKQLYERCKEQNVKRTEELKAVYLKPLTNCKKYVGKDNQDLKRVVQRLYEGQGST